METALPDKTPAWLLSDSVIVFDGICRLCSRWTRFVIRRDKLRRFKLASVQSPEGQEILAHFGLPLDRFDTMLYIEQGRVYTRSDAVLRVIAQINGGWRHLALLRWLYRPLRDSVYDLVARHRYALFGTHAQCWLPGPEDADRFLDGARLRKNTKKENSAKEQGN